MRVRCLKIIDPDTNREVETSSSLTIDKEYTVLSIHVEDGNATKFQIFRDDECTPSFHIANQFEVVNTKIPTNWEVDFLTDSYFSLSPKAWSRVGFWDDYFDGDPGAELIFEKEKEVIFSEDLIKGS